MDKNQLFGFVLIFMLVIGWSIATAPSPEELERQKFVQDSIALAEKLIEQGELSPSPTQNTTALQTQSAQSSDSTRTIQKEERYTLENSLIAIDFSNKGGVISKVMLKDYDKIKSVDGEEIKTKVLLLEDEKNKFEYLLPLNGNVISTANAFFDVQQTANSIAFTGNFEGGQFVQTYRLDTATYELDYDIQFINLNNVLERRPIKLNWKNYLDRVEQNYNFEKYYSSVYFKESDEDSDYCSCRSDDEQELDNKSIQWVSHVHQFFNTTLLMKNGSFDGGKFESKMLSEDSEDLKLTISELNIPYDHGSNEQVAMSMYLGPNVYENLVKYDNGLEEIIPFGRSIFGSINRHIIRPSFNFLSQYIGSKGIVIIVLIFILKMLLYPLMYKMLHSQAKMGALKPELAHLKDKFKDEPQKIQMETMKIYREYGVSPLGGCMPMLMQMPIWYSLFRFFPASITFRQEGFLWATDLSSFDSIASLPFEIPMFGSHVSLFTILWAISTVAYTYYNTKHMDMSANPAMKYVQYMMPIMFLVFFNNYASGLTCYMLFSNLFNIGQTVGTKQFIFKEEKIRAELQLNKAKPKKKKSGFQAKLEQALKEQQAKQGKKK